MVRIVVGAVAVKLRSRGIIWRSLRISQPRRRCFGFIYAHSHLSVVFELLLEAIIITSDSFPPSLVINVLIKPVFDLVAIQDVPVPPVVALAYLVLDQVEIDQLHFLQPLDANLEHIFSVVFAWFGPDFSLDNLDPLPPLRQPPFAPRCDGCLVEKGPDPVLVALEYCEGNDVDDEELEWNLEAGGEVPGLERRQGEEGVDVG